MDRSKTGESQALEREKMEDNTLLQEVGGKPVLEKIHKHFYDELYKHPWLKNYSLHIEQKIIENQQTDFMVANMGGNLFRRNAQECPQAHVYL
jgi:hemoglobin